MSGGCLLADLEEVGLQEDTLTRDQDGCEPRQAPSPPSELPTQSLQGGGAPGRAHRGVCASIGDGPSTSACGGGACSAECGRESIEKQEMGKGGTRQANGGGATSPPGETARTGGGSGQVCVKCCVNPAELIANQREPYCGACLGHSLLQKFKTAVNKHALIQAQDSVLLAFSGGHASSVLLHFLSDLQSHATTPQAAAADRGKTVFRLGILFVNEASVLARPGYDEQQADREIRELAAPFEERGCAVHVVGLEHIFEHSQGPLRPAAPGGEAAQQSSGRGARQANGGCATEMGACEGNGTETRDRGADASMGPGTLHCAQQRLRAVVGALEDATAQEDLVEMLRAEVMQKVATDHGYSKIAVGLCATRLAARVLTGTVKGRGFSLPADLQFVDQRRAMPVVAPLRDCVLKELALLCQLNKWPSVFVPSLDAGPQPRASLNRLTQDFLTLIEDDLPGRTHTILRTAGKLQPFPFNAFPALPPGQRARLQPVQAAGATPQQAMQATPLCALCRAPLSDRERAATEESERGEPSVREGQAGEGAGKCMAGQQQGSSGRASEGRATDGLAQRPVASAANVASGTGVGWPGQEGPEAEDERGRMGACCRSCRDQIGGESGDGLVREWVAQLPWMQPGECALKRRADMRNELAAFLLDDDGS